MTSFVYFDLGGVVIRDFSGTSKWEEAKRVMGVKEEFEKGFDNAFDQYELNELCLSRDVDTLIPIFEKSYEMNFPRGFSILSYLVEHFEKNSSIWPIIERVKRHCRIGLLTNMYINMFDKIKEQNILPNIDWDMLIDSTKVGLQKPDLRIYALAEEKCGFKGNEILFIDNTEKNINAAKNFGWQTFLYDSADPVKSSQKLLKYINELIH